MKEPLAEILEPPAWWRCTAREPEPERPEAMSIFTVACPSCETSFPVDPAKVPPAGVRARCSVCGGIFPVEHPGDHADVSAAVDAPAGEASAELAASPPEPSQPEPPLSTADRLGEASFPEAGPEPDTRPEPWSGVYEEEPREAFEDVDPWAALDEAGTDLQEPEPAGDWDLLEEFEETESVAEAMAQDETVIEEIVVEEEEQVFEEVTFTLPPLTEPEPLVEPEPAGPAEPEPEPAHDPGVAPTDAAPLPQSFQFGRRDPHEKARRLARVLVSDIITYNPERYLRAVENDTLAEDFDEEIRKSWTEYVEQVGSEIARETTYWREALNDLLARGRDVF
jgi:predicted Zn finger-like uncharacterized protein